MSKAAVIYWSGTGNTELMANAVLAGLRADGTDAAMCSVETITADEAAGCDRLALGCPAMGAEVLEEDSFEPFFTELEGKLSGKKVALFGSYGWGDGEWMRNWTERCAQAGAVLADPEGLSVHELPDEEGLARCEELGKQLAAL